MKTTKDNVEASPRPRALRESFSPSQTCRRQLIITGALIFLFTFGVRLLYWHGERLDALKVESMATAGYKDIARLLALGGVGSFFSSTSPLASPNTISYQPGYSLLMALFVRLFGEPDTALQILQMLCDAGAALMVFLIAAELLPLRVAAISGALVALCPQFSWYSIVLLPDSMAVPVILLAIYCVIRAWKRPHIATIMIAGALVGVSCWLRANGLLLAPFLAVVLIPALMKRGLRWRYAAALVIGTILVIAPLTIRNAVVHGYFIPLSLRAGNTLVEGIADYDAEGRFGLPRTDLSLMKWESEIYNRPDYYGNLFEPDGIERERMRIARGLVVIRSHPVWFLGVMTRRAASMLRLGRVHVISRQPPVTHPLALAATTTPAWASSTAEMILRSTLQSERARVSLAPDAGAMLVTGDETKYEDQIASEPIPVQKNQDYLLTLPVKVEQGRMILSVTSDEGDRSYASTVIEAMEGKTPEEQPYAVIQLPFVSSSEGHVRVILSNGASKPSPPVVHVGPIKLFALGPASYLWTRYARAPLRLAQKLFLTAFMLPLVILGAALLARARRWRALIILLAVPAYYFCAQSAVHTEYRYVLALHYFLFMTAAVALYWLGIQAGRGLGKIAIPLFRR